MEVVNNVLQAGRENKLRMLKTLLYCPVQGGRLDANAVEPDLFQQHPSGRIQNSWMPRLKGTQQKGVRRTNQGPIQETKSKTFK